jgi:geranylgeranyl diphosphate synthase type I
VLNGALGNQDLDADTLERAREVLHDLGAVAQVEERIERLTGSGLALLAAAEVCPPADTALVELAHAATRRRY